MAGKPIVRLLALAPTVDLDAEALVNTRSIAAVNLTVFKIKTFVISLL